MQQWYALYTKPHCERQVESALSAKGIEIFFPTLPAPVPRPGRPATRPFFPCYLFAHVELEDVGISRLNWIPGMRHLVMFGGIPARVDDLVIARIREHLQLPHAMDQQGEILKSGDRVVITAGPLRDVEAVFDQRLSAAGRVRILIQLLERWAVAEVEAIGLRKLPAVSKAVQPPRWRRR